MAAPHRKVRAMVVSCPDVRDRRFARLVALARATNSSEAPRKTESATVQLPRKISDGSLAPTK
jgi:hypothetical protein